MRRIPALSLAALVLAALPLHAGDPVPDVDVILEQIPGGAIRFDSPRGGGFDEVRVSVPRKLQKEISPERLPEGWSASREGRELVLAGPEVVPPVRLRLKVAGNELPAEVSYEVRRHGVSLLRRERVVPPQGPAPAVRNNLQGVVQLPPQVAPGETVAFQALGTAQLPPGGRFVLSGVVTEPFSQEEWERIPAIMGGKKKETMEKSRIALPAGGLELVGEGGCEALAPGAAALAAAAGEPGLRAYQTLSNTMKTRHDTAKGVIQNIRYACAVAPAGQDGDGISIKEKGIWYGVPEEGSTVWRAVSARPVGDAGVSWGPAAEDLPLDRPEVRIVTMTGEPTDRGCRFRDREPEWPELARALAGPAREAESPGSSGGAVHAVELPPDLRPGDRLSLQYVDLYGDVWLDVPEVPGMEVALPPPSGEEAAPCVRAATPRAQLGDLVCVCGTFPSPESWSGLRVGDRPAGTPASGSASAVWIRLPEGTAPGRNIVTGAREMGFAPACTAAVQVVSVRGEMDTQRMLRGESTPMRLTVDGTTDPVRLRVINRTPAVIEIEGGVEQEAETSGGEQNVLTRQVRGVSRGSFDVEWTLAPTPCPCGG